MLMVLQEVLHAPNVYDGKAADVWATGVHLYIMLVGWYPFTDPREPKNFSKTASNIMKGKFAFPKNLQISQECKDLIIQMLQRDPRQRITLPELKQTAWFQTNLSKELTVPPSSVAAANHAAHAHTRYCYPGHMHQSQAFTCLQCRMTGCNGLCNAAL
jgi:serine/threonine protein kinase